MEDTETELTSSEPDALGADFITVELDTQPIEYVVKWAEVGSKFTISCVKKESDEGTCLITDQLVKVEPDERFFVPYEAVYTECEDTDPSLIASQEIVRSDSDVDEQMEVVNSHLEGEEEDDDDSSSSSSDDDDDDDDDEDLEEDEGSDGEWKEEGSQSRDKKFNCHYCGKNYSHSSSLARHLHMHTAGERSSSPKARPEDNQKFLQCNMCGVRCNGKRLLAIHKKCHKTKRLHTCNTCGKTFNHSSSLSRHRLIHKRGLDKKLKPLFPTPTPAPIVTVTQNRRGPKKKKAPPAENKFVAGEQEKQYQCTQCDMVFSNSTSLSKHQVSHVRQLLNSYAQGKDALDKSSDLKIRLKLCSRDKPNYYTLCKKNKRGKGGRKRLPLPPPSDECEGPFDQGGDSDGHEHMHNSEKRYGCNSCKKTFVRLSNLKQHQQTHAMGKLYECQHCGKTFVHSSSFSRHKKVHAGLKQEPKLCSQGQMIDETAPLESESE